MTNREGKELIQHNILATKRYVPTASSVLVERTRLFKLLDQGVGKKLVLVSAPAGYGKTSLLSEWACNRGHRFSWLSLDEQDNDLKLFLTYFTNALQQIHGDIGRHVLSALQTPTPPAAHLLLTDLINEISASSRFFIVILDDFHTISEPDIQEALTFLLEHQPAQMTLVISSRSDPPWPLSRLRVVNEIQEIRATDLRFTLKETTTYLDSHLNRTLSPESILALYKRTEGWIAGLQLAAISMRGRKDLSAFIQSFSGNHRLVVDYLMEEVLDRQPPEIRDFLLKTSLLDTLTGPLCTLITGQNISPQILASLEKGNVFLTALDDTGQTYRYHSLFADLLQKRLQLTHPDLVPEIHHQASLWYGRNGFLNDAVRHALKTRDPKFGLAQIKAHILPILQSGRISMVREWLRSFPEETLLQDPVLCVAQASVAIKDTSIDKVEELLGQAETAVDNAFQKASLDPSLLNQVSTQVAILQSILSRKRGDPVEKQQKIVLEALEFINPSRESTDRATLLLRLGFCYIDIGKDEKADHFFKQAYQLGKGNGNLYSAHTANYARMVIANRHAQLDTLAEICRQSLENLVRSNPQDRSLAGIACIMQGNLFYERNNLLLAERKLTRGIKLIRKDGIFELMVKGWFALACTRIALGKEFTLPDLVSIAQQGNPSLQFYAASLQARLHLLLARSSPGSDHFSRAAAWAESQTLGLRKQSSYDWEMLEKLVYARVVCLQYQASPDTHNRSRLVEILDFLADQRESLLKLDWLRILIEMDIVRALLLAALDRVLESNQALEQALLLAQPRQFARIFLDEAEPMRELLRRSMHHGTCGTYAQELLLSFQEDQDSILQGQPLHTGQLVLPLSQRESQVLRFLETDLSVPRIAAELVISESTVRSHIKNIYNKLEVHSRYEAIQKGKSLHLL